LRMGRGMILLHLFKSPCSIDSFKHSYHMNPEGNIYNFIESSSFACCILCQRVKVMGTQLFKLNVIIFILLIYLQHPVRIIKIFASRCHLSPLYHLQKIERKKTMQKWNLFFYWTIYCMLLKIMFERIHAYFFSFLLFSFGEQYWYCGAFFCLIPAKHII
jgi:hypothetical protein